MDAEDRLQRTQHGEELTGPAKVGRNVPLAALAPVQLPVYRPRNHRTRRLVGSLAVAVIAAALAALVVVLLLR